jgi:hypothetical protein
MKRTHASIPYQLFKRLGGSITQVASRTHSGELCYKTDVRHHTNWFFGMYVEGKSERDSYFLLQTRPDSGEILRVKGSKIEFAFSQFTFDELSTIHHIQGVLLTIVSL